jgi:prepilin-type N-terminal cleavage/methylation domain-containing protein
MKKGFTLVELVIVIAVIVILAAVLIPTFAALTKKADLAADEQLLHDMNTALIMAEGEGKKPAHIGEVKEILSSAGINAYDKQTVTPKSKGYRFAWSPDDNRIHLTNEEPLVSMTDLTADYTALYDYAYNQVKERTEFKCYVRYQEKAFTVTGEDAKKLYATVTSCLGPTKIPDYDSFSTGIDLTFYDSPEEYTYSSDPYNIRFHGCYYIRDNDSARVSWAPYVSLATSFSCKPGLYRSVLAMISSLQE